MTVFTVQVDQTFLDEGLPQLREYLLSGELYWVLSCGVPPLTLGNVLLALTRLEAAEPVEARELREKVKAFRVQWSVAWEKKIARETENRLRLWTQFLSEREDDERPTRAVYAANIHGRVILQLLLKELPNPKIQAALAEQDAFLRMNFTPGAFVWEEIFRPAFAPAEYWFLYGNL